LDPKGPFQPKQLIEVIYKSHVPVGPGQINGFGETELPAKVPPKEATKSLDVRLKHLVGVPRVRAANTEDETTKMMPTTNNKNLPWLTVVKLRCVAIF